MKTAPQLTGWAAGAAARRAARAEWKAQRAAARKLAPGRIVAKLRKGGPKA